jgi:hypothetical protein
MRVKSKLLANGALIRLRACAVKAISVVCREYTILTASGKSQNDPLGTQMEARPALQV